MDIFKNSGKFLIAAYLNNTPNIAKEIFHKWFTGERYINEKTFAKYGFDIESKEVLKEQLKHENWSKQNEFYYTPTILFNGYVLPEIYNIDDIQFLI
jgi:hypothetical protein